MKISNVEITHADKIICKKPKITKLDIVNYYNKIFSKIRPFLLYRPLSAIRCHGKDFSQKFFKKHPNDDENVEKFYFGTKKSQNLYFFVKDKQQFINQVQLGTIEFHLWNMLANSKTPDILIFDLDPDENISLSKLRYGIKQLKQILDELGLKSFLKTSGGKGYHVYIPFKSVTSYAKLNTFAKTIASLLEQKNAELFTTNMSKSARKQKIFIDFLRNKKTATCVAPYSLRLRKGLTISMPISWKDLDNVKPNEFNIFSTISSNPWKDFFKVNQTLN